MAVQLRWCRNGAEVVQKWCSGGDTTVRSVLVI